MYLEKRTGFMKAIKITNKNNSYMIESDFEHNNLRCVVIFTQMGHRCGYVGVPKGHKLYGTDYNELDIDVHGGLTYSNSSPDYPVQSNLWWFGFDCAHYCDRQDFKQALEYFPENEKYTKRRMQTESIYGHDVDEEVRSLFYVATECQSLAYQISEMKGDK